MGPQQVTGELRAMEQVHVSAPTSRRARVLAFISGWGSLLDLWPSVKYEEVYPYKAEDVLRRSGEEVSKAFWTAFGEVTDEVTSEQEEGEEQATA